MSNNRKCQRTGKRIFRSEDEAKRALSRIRTSQDHRDKTPDRFYKCPFCGGIHLTSKTQPLGDVVVITEPDPPPEADPLDVALFDVAALERVVRRCIAEQCGACMHDPEWGAYLIRKGVTA